MTGWAETISAPMAIPAASPSASFTVSRAMFVERINLSLRQRAAAIGRRSATPRKSADDLRQQLALFRVPPWHQLQTV
jgi:hypothetical protein